MQKDGAGTDVGGLAHDAVAEVREVVCLRAVIHRRLLQLDEVADMRLFADVALGTEMREGPDLGACPHHRVGDDAIRLQGHAFAHVVALVSTRPTSITAPACHARRVAAKHGKALDGRVFGARSMTAIFDARALADGHALRCLLRRMRFAHDALERGELGAVVDAVHDRRRVTARQPRLLATTWWRSRTMSVR